MADNELIASVGFVNDLSSLQKRANQAGEAYGSSIQKGISKGLSRGINDSSYTQPLGRISGKANEFEKSMAAANARVIAFGASVAPIFAMRAAFDKLVESTIEVEKSMTGINAIFGLGASNLRTFTAQLFNVANQTGQSFTMATEAATEFARQGLNVEETLKRTSAALILNKISGLGMGEAVSSITSILNGFSKEALNSADIINRMTAVDTQFAVSAGDLAEALKRVGASANDANVSFNQTLGLITAARQITGREGSVIGNSFKTMFTRLQRPEVLNDLEEAGIKVRDLNGKILPLIDVLKNLAGTYNGLAQSQKSFVSEAVGGVYQINILKGIMRDLSSGVSIYDSAVNAADNSTSAVTKRMDILNSTLASGLVRTMNDLSLASSNVGQMLFGNSMKNGINSFDSLLKGTAENTNPDNKAPEAQAVQAGIKGLGNFLSGPGLQLGVNIILKLLNRLVDFAGESGKDLLGLDTGMKERENLEKRYFAILSQEKEKIDEIITGKKTIAQIVASTVKSSVQDSQRSNLISVISQEAAKQTLPQIHYNKEDSGSSIPNLYNPIAEALRRENIATGGHAKLSFSPLLVSQNNPYGLAAIDSRNQANATDAVNQHKMLGQSIPQIRNAKTSIPNLATGLDLSVLLSAFGYASQMGNSVDGIQKFISITPQLFSVTEKEIYAKRRLVKEFDEMGKTLLSTGKPQQFYGSTYNNLSQLSASPLSKDINDFRQQIKDFTDVQNKSKKDIWSTGFKVANWSSFGGAALSQAAGNISPTAAASVDSLETGVTAAGQALIAFPNKIGMALSAGLAASGLYNSLDTFTKGLDNAKAATDSELSNLKNINESLRTLSQTSSNLSNLYIDSSSSVETIARESKKYADTIASLSQLPGGQNMSREIASAPDEDARQGIIQNFLAEQSKKAETVASLQSAKELFAQKSFLGLNHVPFLQKDAGYSYSEDFKKESVQEQLNENASVAIANMSNNFKNSLTDSVTSLDKFNEILGAFQGEDANTVRDYLSNIKQVGGPEAYNQIIQQIRANLGQAIVNKNPEYQGALLSSRQRLSDSQLGIDDAVKQEQYLKRLFLNSGAVATNNILDVKQASLRSSYNQGLARISGFEANSNLFGETHGARTIAQRNYGINIQKNAIETRNSLNNLNLETNRNLINSLGQDFDKILKTSDLAQNLNGEKNVSIGPGNAALIQAINTGLSNVLRGSSGDIISRFKNNNGQFDFQKFAKVTAQSGSDNTLVQSKIEKYLNSQQSIDILKTLNQSGNKQVEILQDFKSKSLEAQQELNASIREADFKKLNSYFGGITSLLDRNSARSLMRDETRGISMMNGKSPEIQAQGAAMVLKSLQSQGFVISDDNALVKKAHQIFVQSGIQTYQKYANRVEGISDRKYGSGSAESIGLRQGYNQDLNKVLETQYSSAFKPEGINSSENNGEFIDTNSYLKSFDNGLDAATQSLINFPKAIQTTINDLQTATNNIGTARQEYDTTLKDVDANLKTLSDNILSKYSEATEGGKVNKQNPILSYLQSLAGQVLSSVMFAVTTALINKVSKKNGGGNYKDILDRISGSLSKEKMAHHEPIQKLEEKISQTILTGSNNIVKEIKSNTQISGSMSSNRKNFSKNSTPMGSEYDIPKPQGWEYEGSPSPKLQYDTQAIYKKFNVQQPKTIYDSVVGKLGNNKQQISRLLEKLDENSENLSKFQAETFKKFSQQLRFGNKTGNSFVDSIFTGNYKNIDRGALEKQLFATVGVDKLKGNEGLLAQRQSLQIQYEQKLKENESLSNYIKNSKGSSFRDNMESVRSNARENIRSGLLSARRADRLRFNEGVSGELQGAPDSTPPTKFADTKSIIEGERQKRYFKERLDYLKQVQKEISASGTQAPLSQKTLDTINKPNLKQLLSQVRYYGLNKINPKFNLPSMDELKDFVQDVPNNKLNDKLFSSLKNGNFLGLKGFKNLSTLGKVGTGLGVLGIAGTGVEAYQDFSKKNYIEGAGNLANNILGFAGPAGTAASLTNRLIKHDVNKYGELESMWAENSGDANVIAQRERLAPRLIAQNKRKKSEQAFSDFSNTLIPDFLQQRRLTEIAQGDTSTAQGKARSILNPLQGALLGINDTDKYGNKLGLRALKGNERNTLEGVYRVLHPEDKTEKGFGADFGRYVSSHQKEVQGKLEGYYGKTLPTLLDGGGDPSKNRIGQTPFLKQAYQDVDAFKKAQQDEQHNDLQALTEALNKLSNEGINTNNNNATIASAKTQIDFATLPINVTVTSEGAIGQTVLDAINKSLQQLQARITKLDGQTTPSTVG